MAVVYQLRLVVQAALGVSLLHRSARITYIKCYFLCLSSCVKSTLMCNNCERVPFYGHQFSRRAWGCIIFTADIIILHYSHNISLFYRLVLSALTRAQAFIDFAN